MSEQVWYICANMDTHARDISCSYMKQYLPTWAWRAVERLRPAAEGTRPCCTAAAALGSSSPCKKYYTGTLLHGHDYKARFTRVKQGQTQAQATGSRGEICLSKHKRKIDNGIFSIPCACFTLVNRAWMFKIA